MNNTANNENASMTYAEAVRKAVYSHMKNDKSIVVLGQDISAWGGAGKVFSGFAEEFPGRVIDTPISEAASAGMAIGMAIQGMRPIIEHTFADFSLHAMDQIINQAAKINALSNKQFDVPVIFRIIVNSGRNYGATHAQNLESLFIDIPGLKMFYPAIPQDAFDLMNIALQSSEPIVFVEHKLLHNITGQVLNHPTSHSRAEIVQNGSKLTIITYGRMVTEAFTATANIPDVTIVNLRSLSPIDAPTILTAAQTGNVLLIEEGYGTVSAKIAAFLTDAGFSGKITRLTSQFEPLLQNREAEILPNAEKIREIVASLI